MVNEQDNSISITPNLWIAGDLAYYVIMLGKEGSSGHWCYRCDLHKDIWKIANHEHGTLWTNESLKAMADLGYSGTNAKGVKKYPLWDFIEVDKFILPVLHTSMGMGNAVMANLMDIINTKIDVIPPNEIQVRNSLTMNNQILISLVDERNEWDNSENGHTLRRSITKLRRSEKIQLKQYQHKKSLMPTINYLKILKTSKKKEQ